MKKMKIFWFVVLVGSLIFTMGSCKGKTTSTEAAVRGAKGALPISDGKTTLTMFVAGMSGANVVSSYGPDNTFTRKIIKDTGINLEITSGNNADRTEKLNLLLSTGTYPEVIIFEGFSMNDMIYYANQEIFIPLDEYDPLSYPNIKAAFDEYPALNQKLRGTDGKLYALPYVNDCLHCVYSMGRIWYFMPWIRDNGRKVPDTTEEFADYLRWVKNRDPNGNGIADEIPMAFDTGDIRNVIAYFAKPFMPFVNSGSYFGLALDNNRNIVEQYKDPNFRESLKYLTGLYREGLILPDSFTMTRDQIKALATSSTPILAVEAISWKTDSTPQTAERWIETFNLPPLRGPSGQRNAGNQDPWSIMGAMYIITDKCKNPELAIALYDYFLNFDVELDGYIGPKGTAWDDPDPGTTSLMGGEPYYKLLVAQGRQTNNTSWDQANPMIRSSKFRLGEQAVGAPEAKRWLETGDPSLRDFLLPNMSYAEEMWYFTSLENSKYAMPTELFIPPLSISDDDNARVSDILATLETYKDQVMVEFITGVRNINSDTDWNNYLAELDRQGSAEYVSILQKYIK